MLGSVGAAKGAMTAHESSSRDSPMAKIGIPIPNGASVAPIGNSNIAARKPNTVGRPRRLWIDPSAVLVILSSLGYTSYYRLYGL